MLRGKPTTGMRFDANVVQHGDLDAAVSLKMDKGDTGWGEDHDDFNFEAAGNEFGTDQSGDLATGDFDGDKRTDVFVATGTAWFFSRGGQESWEFLHASDKLTRELGFADIDNDGVTDVLYRDGAGNLGFLKSGRVPLQPLTTTPEPMANLRFGDFDGDGLTDIFFTRGGQWQVWFGSLKDWRPTQTSGFSISAFLFGEFDAVKGTDVAAITSGKWQISWYGGRALCASSDHRRRGCHPPAPRNKRFLTHPPHNRSTLDAATRMTTSETDFVIQR
jgi:FG-GAP-like repeat